MRMMESMRLSLPATEIRGCIPRVRSLLFRSGVTITPDMINCTGCRIEGAKTPFCDKLCPVHNCVREKRLDTCADCGQMDGCPTLGRIAVNSPFVLENLRRLCSEGEAR